MHYIKGVILSRRRKARGKYFCGEKRLTLGRVGYSALGVLLVVIEIKGAITAKGGYRLHCL